MTAKSERRQRQNNLIRAGAGLGLMTAGALLVLLLLRTPPKGSGDSFSPDQGGLSVVPVAVKYAAPELSLEDLDGKAVSLTGLRESVVLLNNWAIWCPPCKAEMPTLESYYEAHSAEGLMIVAIEAGSIRDQVRPFVQSYGLKFDVWLDPDNQAMAAFRNGNLPNSFVIDRTGTVRLAWTGEINRAMLEKYVTPLLKED